MIAIIGKTLTGRQHSFNQVLAFSFDADRIIPCDSFDFTAVIQAQSEEFHEITAYLNGSVLFNGIVDTHELITSNKGMLIKISCRNKTARLIDNEVKPSIYSRLTSTQLFEQYAKPFGVVATDFPYVASQWLMQVRKGASYWSVIEEYCKINYHAQPYINHNHILTINPYNNTTHTISNSIVGALQYSSLKIKRDYHKLISKLYMKTATDTLNYYYGVIVDNPVAIAMKIKRERYYHPNDLRLSLNPSLNNAASNSVNQNYTKRLIANSNRDYFSATITLPALHNIKVGDSIILSDSALNNNHLYVSRVSLNASNSGLTTTLVVRDKSHLKLA